eukprot:Gb_02682 [translate_table: standard]
MPLLLRWVAHIRRQYLRNIFMKDFWGGVRRPRGRPRRNPVHDLRMILTDGDLESGIQKYKTNSTSQMHTGIVHDAEIAQYSEAKIVAVDMPKSS